MLFETFVLITSIVSMGFLYKLCMRLYWKKILTKDYVEYMCVVPKIFWNVPEITLETLKKTIFWKALITTKKININEFSDKLRQNRLFVADFLIENNINMFFLNNVIMYGESITRYMNKKNIKLLKLYETKGHVEQNGQELKCNKFIPNAVYNLDMIDYFCGHSDNHGIIITISNEDDRLKRLEFFSNCRYKYCREVELPNDTIVQFSIHKTYFINLRCDKAIVKGDYIKISDYNKDNDTTAEKKIF